MRAPKKRAKITGHEPGRADREGLPAGQGTAPGQRFSAARPNRFREVKEGPLPKMFLPSKSPICSRPPTWANLLSSDSPTESGQPQKVVWSVQRQALRSLIPGLRKDLVLFAVVPKRGYGKSDWPARFERFWHLLGCRSKLGEPCSQPLGWNQKRSPRGVRRSAFPLPGEKKKHKKRETKAYGDASLCSWPPKVAFP